LQRKRIFISHAAPDDNDFTKWLSLKLIALGYDVWCDVLFLEKGEDFWRKIDHEIRNNVVKFLIVSSSISNEREGVLKEIAVASKVKKKVEDENFIVPLSIDESLSYDDTNIDLVRLNAIDFKASWAEGLQALIQSFERQNVPKEPKDPSRSKALYEQVFLHDRSVIEKKETFDSNWFPILEFPSELRFHDFDWRIPKRLDNRPLPYPAVKYKNHLCTFAWAYDFLDVFPKTKSYDPDNTVRIPVDEILKGQYSSNFISNYLVQRLIVQLLNRAFMISMSERDVRTYELTNKTAYWVEKGVLEKDKFQKVQLVGKMKNKNWHFGISGAGKLYPIPVLMISSHIFFTSNGKELIDSKSIQHSSRRRQGRNWWNDKWRTKLLAFAKYISSDDETIVFKVGSEEEITISNRPIQFYSDFGYVDPSERALNEELELSELYDNEEDLDEE
jgi:hypothetical protein